METESSDEQRTQLLISLRELVSRYLRADQHETALFWAERLLCLGGGGIEDVLVYFNILMRRGKHWRVAAYLQRERITYRHEVLRHYAVESLFACRRYEELIDLIEGDQCFDIDAEGIGDGRLLTESENELLDRVSNDMMIPFATTLTLGKAYLELENRTRALECFRECLQRDAFCVDAFDLIVDHNLATADEMRKFFQQHHQNTNAHGERMSQLLVGLYDCKLGSSADYSKPTIEAKSTDGTTLDVISTSFQSDLVVLTAKAQRLYNCGNFRDALAVTSVVLKRERFYFSIIPLHIAVLVELNRSSELFLLAHNLVDNFPENSIAWYAVGTYYYLIRQYEPAKRYLAKATSMKRWYAPAWLVFGHAFAVEREHDQAMNKYLKAAKFLTGCHLPLVYIGLEYSLTNNQALGAKFLKEAMKMPGGSSDPFCLHEMGTLCFADKQYCNAWNYFDRALDAVLSRMSNCNNRPLAADLGSRLKQPISERWEPLLNNMAHTARKRKSFADAIMLHKRALSLRPRNAGTHLALAMCHLVTGDFGRGIECLERCLSLRGEDNVAKALLHRAVELSDRHRWLLNDVADDGGGNRPNSGALWMDVEVKRFSPPPKGVQSSSNVTPVSGYQLDASNVDNDSIDRSVEMEF